MADVLVVIRGPYVARKEECENEPWKGPRRSNMIATPAQRASIEIMFKIKESKLFPSIYLPCRTKSKSPE